MALIRRKMWVQAPICQAQGREDEIQQLQNSFWIFLQNTLNFTDQRGNSRVLMDIKNSNKKFFTETGNIINYQSICFILKLENSQFHFTPKAWLNLSTL